MTQSDWAATLAKLDDAYARREALLMMSDEDWIADSEREWLREAALRQHVLDPATDHKSGHYWASEPKTDVSQEQYSACPVHLIQKMGEVNCHDKREKGGGYTRYTPHVICWLLLLNAITKE